MGYPTTRPSTMKVGERSNVASRPTPSVRWVARGACSVGAGGAGAETVLIGCLRSSAEARGERPGPRRVHHFLVRSSREDWSSLSASSELLSPFRAAYACSWMAVETSWYLTASGRLLAFSIEAFSVGRYGNLVTRAWS